MSLRESLFLGKRPGSAVLTRLEQVTLRSQVRS
jgi:hypothetical protein